MAKINNSEDEKMLLSYKNDLLNQISNFESAIPRFRFVRKKLIQKLNDFRDRVKGVNTFKDLKKCTNNLSKFAKNYESYFREEKSASFDLGAYFLMHTLIFTPLALYMILNKNEILEKRFRKNKFSFAISSFSYNVESVKEKVEKKLNVEQIDNNKNEKNEQEQSVEVKDDKAAEVKNEVDKIEQVRENKLKQIREEKGGKPLSKMSKQKSSKPLKEVKSSSQSKTAKKQKDNIK